MSKIKNSGLNQYGSEPFNSSNLGQLALKGLQQYKVISSSWRSSGYSTAVYHIS